MASGQPDKTSVQSPETIEQLFAALESPLLSYALRLTGDRVAAEDLVQEAFMKLHAQYDEVREPRGGQCRSRRLQHLEISVGAGDSDELDTGLWDLLIVASTFAPAPQHRSLIAEPRRHRRLGEPRAHHARDLRSHVRP